MCVVSLTLPPASEEARLPHVPNMGAVSNGTRISWVHISHAIPISVRPREGKVDLTMLDNIGEGWWRGREEGKGKEEIKEEGGKERREERGESSGLISAPESINLSPEFTPAYKCL